MLMTARLSTRDLLEQLLAERILVLDGSMGALTAENRELTSDSPEELRSMIRAIRKHAADTIERTRMQNDSFRPSINAALGVHTNWTRQLTPHLSGVYVAIHKQQPGCPARSVQ